MNFLSKIRIFLFLAFLIAVITGLFVYSLWGDEIPITEIRNYIRTSNLTPIAFITIYAVLSVFIPTTPLMAIAGVLFGFYYGLIYSIVGGIISSSGIFLISRHLGRSFVEKLIESKATIQSFFQKYGDRIARRGFLTAMILRMTPIMPFNILGFLMGVSKVGFLDYIFGTVVGLVPSHLLTVYFGVLIFTETFREISFFLSIALALGLAAWLLFRFLIVWSYFKREDKKD